VQRIRGLNGSNPLFHQALADTAIALEEKRYVERRHRIAIVAPFTIRLPA
jgi:hypothetical protein